jgi:hypothetical protein
MDFAGAATSPPTDRRTGIMHMTANRLRGGFAAGATVVLLGLTVAPVAHASGSSTASTGSSLAATAGVARPAGDPPCGTIYGDQDPVSSTWTYLGTGLFQAGNLIFNAGGTYTYNIRTGISSACSIIGTIGTGEAINYDCTLVDDINRTWTQLHTSSGERGWVLDQHLPEVGSWVPCPKKS